MAFGVSGLVSGLDTESIISQMMNLERRPILLLQRREADFQAKISGLGSLKGGLADLQSAMASLKGVSSFSSFTATSGNTNVLSISTGDGALPASYQMEVTQLAAAQQVRSAGFASVDDVVGTGTLTIQVGSGTAIDVEIDATNNTLSGIAQAINDAGGDVTAAIIDDGSDTGNFFLTLASTETGAGNTISLSMVDATDGDPTNDTGLSSLYTDPLNQTLTETQAAANAKMSVNGIAVERPSNIITDLMTGATITLKQADPGNPFDVTVSRDNNTVEAKVKTFVAKYNAAVEAFDELQSYDPETGSGGELQGDSTTRQLRSKLQRMVYDQVDGVASDVNGLSRLGVAVDSDGKLSLDSEVLSTALENNRDDVISFFTNDVAGNEGVALRFDNLLESYLNSSTGLFSSKEEGLQSSIDDIGGQIERINFRLAMREENLRNQFLALESLMAQFQATSGALEQQLQSLSNLSSYISTKK